MGRTATGRSLKRQHDVVSFYRSRVTTEPEEWVYAEIAYSFNDPQTDPVTVIGEVMHYVLPYDWGF